MAVSSVSGVTSTYTVSVARTSSTTPSSCTTAVSSTTAARSTATTSSTTSTRSSASTTSTKINYSSATAKATSSTTVTYSGASSTAKVSSTTSSATAKKVSSTTASASTTASTTAKKVSSTTATSSTTASTTVESLADYPYLAHLGEEGIKKAEMMLTNLGFDDYVDGDIVDGMKKFRTAVGMEKYGIFSDEVLTKLKEISGKSGEYLSKMEAFGIDASNVADGIMQFKKGMKIDSGDLFNKLSKVIEKSKSMLETLGFYNRNGGELEIDSLQAEGASGVLSTSLNHFYAVYAKEYAEGDWDEDGEDYSISKLNETYKKLEKVYEKYTELTGIVNEGKFDAVFEKMGFESDIQKKTFALSWTFLREGMGLTVTQAAGIMGNIGWESRFSTINAQDSKGYSGVFDDEYEYETENEIGYGLLQWTEKTRKQDLLDLANEMGLTVDNINVQFACMRSESYDYQQGKNAWDMLRKVEGAENTGAYDLCDRATKIGRDEIEICFDETLSNRQEFAHIIYDAMLTIQNEGYTL